MAETDPAMLGSGRPGWKLSILVLLRATLSISALVAAYFLIPTRDAGGRADVPWLIVELCIFGVVVGVQVPAIVTAKYPILRAVEALAILLPVYLLIFARIYLANSLNDPDSFNQPLTIVTALYFTVTMFASVGFGDIVAQTDSMRLLVTVQMLLNLVLLGVVIKVLTSAARRGVARRAQQPGVAGGGPSAEL